MAPVPEAVRYRTSHRTTYEYGLPMADGYTVAYLLPRPTALQLVEAAEVTIDPAPDERAEHIDVFGNRVLQLGVHHAHDTLTLHAESEVVVAPGAVTSRGEPWEVAALRVGDLRGGDAIAVRPFAGSSPYVPLTEHGVALRAIAEEAFTPHRPIVDAARGAVPRHPRALRVRPVVHRRVDAPVGRAGRRARRVPGLRPPRCRLPAHARARRPLRQRVHRDRPAARTPPPRRSRRLARLVLVVGAAARLARLRPDERPTCRRTATSRSPGAATTATSRPSAASSSDPPSSRPSPSRSTSSGYQRRRRRRTGHTDDSRLAEPVQCVLAAPAVTL